MITITVNGDEKTLSTQVSLYDYVCDLKLDPTKVAIELNLEIVPKAQYQDVMLKDRDNLEIVHFIGGGSV